MITKIYIKGIMVLMTCFLNSEFDIVNNEPSSIGLREQLAMDYEEIFEFSEKIRFYGVTRENFEAFFQEGAVESFNFHQSTHYMKQSKLNRMIQSKLIYNPNLKHPLTKPSKRNLQSLNVRDVLNTFSGEWNGKWKTMRVRHLWLPFKEINLKINESSKIIGFQTCFTGDGFGWNYLIQKDDEIIILGHVYHFNSKGTLDYENPHYAFLNDHNQLTWVSDNHVYYEFVCDDKKCGNDKHYVITAVPYTKQSRLKFGIPIQAIYVSGNNASRM